MNGGDILASLTVPWGRQQIELQPLAFDGTGVQLLRLRIREGTRFTIFDVDAVTALAWADAMRGWALRQTAAQAAAECGSEP